jgi:sugar/nucleoside kinase (ribokinase family)
VVKLGGRGSIACTHRETLAVPAFFADVVDTTGAGDNFVAGLIFGLVRQLPLAEALRVAAPPPPFRFRPLARGRD